MNIFYTSGWGLPCTIASFFFFFFFFQWFGELETRLFTGLLGYLLDHIILIFTSSCFAQGWVPLPPDVCILELLKLSDDIQIDWVSKNLSRIVVQFENKCKNWVKAIVDETSTRLKTELIQSSILIVSTRLEEWFVQRISSKKSRLFRFVFH